VERRRGEVLRQDQDLVVVTYKPGRKNEDAGARERCRLGRYRERWARASPEYWNWGNIAGVTVAEG
jgi:hypothetical protein